MENPSGLTLKSPGRPRKNADRNKTMSGIQLTDEQFDLFAEYANLMGYSSLSTAIRSAAIQHVLAELPSLRAAYQSANSHRSANGAAAA